MFKISFKIIFLVAILGVIIAFPTGKTLAATSSPVLFLGMRGLAVQIAQIVLNLDPATRLGVSGDGSLGKETEYFGDKTRLAVIKFQKKYGIMGETGQIGPQTVQLINQLGPKLLSARKSKMALIPTDWPEPSAQTKETVSSQRVTPAIRKITPKIYSLSPTIVSNGGTITLRGEGFTKTGNTIITKFQTFNNISSADGQSLSFNFSIPLSGEVLSSINSLPGGVASSISVPITVYVTNSNGKSGELTFNYQIR